jgi:hypothetical protein
MSKHESSDRRTLEKLKHRSSAHEQRIESEKEHEEEAREVPHGKAGRQEREAGTEEMDAVLN